MVFESLLVSVLNRFLGPYVKNLDASQLKVGIWSGDVHLERLEVKETALSQLDIPLRVFKGYLGKLNLKVPWNNLYADPVHVEVEDVYIVAGPALAIKYNPAKEEKEEREAKQKKLREIEEARKKAQEPKGDKKPAEDPGFVEKLVSQIIRNVQVTVKNIHIRFEDGVTNPRSPYAFGITLDSLLLQSTDSQWQVRSTGIADNGSTLIHKVARLQCLALYWNCGASLLGTDPPYFWQESLEKDIARPGVPLPDLKYVLKPLSAIVKLKLCTRPGQLMDVPQIFAQLVVEELFVSLERHQYLDMMSLVESMDRMVVGRKFRKYRPYIPLRSNPEAWWHYAYNAVLGEDVRRRLNMWSWKHIKKHRERCKDYVKLYTEKLLVATPPPYLVAQILDLEDELDIFNITVCRQLAETEARKRKEERQREEESSGGWLSWASSWVTGGDSSSAGDEEEPVIPSEQELAAEREKLYRAIGYSEKGKTADYPKHYVAHKAEFTLKQVSLELLNCGDPVGLLVTESVSATVLNRPSSKNLSVSACVGELRMSGSVRGGSLPEVMSSKAEGGRQDPLLQVEIELHPLESKCDQRVKVSLHPIQVTYDKDTVDEIICMFKPPRVFRLQKLSSTAASTLNQLKTQSRAGLQHSISQRKLIDIDVTLRSPVLVVPEGGVLSNESSQLVLDLGSLRVTSDIQPLIPDVKKATQKELEEAFYDRFNLQLSGMKVMLADPGEDWRSARKFTTSSMFLLKPMTVEVTLQKSLLPNDTRLPGLKIGGELPLISLVLSDWKLKQLLKLVQSVPIPPSFEDEPSDSSADELDYSPSFAEPSSLDTSDVVTTVSETVMKAVSARSPTVMEADEDSDDGDDFFTASEGEEEDEGSRRKDGFRSSTKVVLNLSVSEVMLTFAEIRDTIRSRRLTVAVTSLGLQVGVRSWDTGVTASIGSLLVLDHFNNDQIQLLVGGSEETQDFFKLTYTKVNRDSPYYRSQFKNTEQSIETNLSTVSVRVQRESLANLMVIGRDIVSVLKTKEKEIAEKEKTLETVTSGSEDSSQTAKSQVVERASHEKELVFSAKLQSAELTLCDSAGDIVKGGVEGLTASVEAYSKVTTVVTRIRSVSVIDLDRKSIHSQVLVPVSLSHDTVVVMVTSHKGATEGESYHDLGNADLDVTLRVQRVRSTVVFRFINRVMGFVQRLKVDEGLLESAKHAANKTAAKTVETLKEKSSSRVRLSVQIASPDVIVPLNASSKAAVIIHLGQVIVSNSFRLARDMYSLGMGKSLSSEGLPAVVDAMSAKISSVQVYRVLDLMAGIDPAHSDHTVLQPLELSVNINRNLGGWCKDIPSVDMEVTLESVVVSVHPVDYHAVMSIVDSLGDSKYKTPTKTAPRKILSEKKDKIEPQESQLEKEQSQISTNFRLKAAISQVTLSVASDKHGHIGSVNVLGLSTVVNLQSNSSIDVRAILHGFSVTGSDPKALYPKLVFSVEGSEAVNVKVLMQEGGTEGDKYMDMKNYDVSVSANIGQLTVIALMRFIHRLINFAKELKVSESTIENVKQSAREGASAAITKVQELHQNGKRIKISASIASPLIKIPTHSDSDRLVVASLGELSLSNFFHIVEESNVTEGLPPVYEKYEIRLTAVEVFSEEQVAEWDSAVLETPIADKLSILAFVSRNLSSSWYKEIPVISVEAMLSVLQIHISGDEVQVLSDIVEGNLTEDREEPETEEPAKDKDSQLEEEEEKGKPKPSSFDDVKLPPMDEPVLYRVAVVMDGVGIKLHNRRESFMDLERPPSIQPERDLSTAVADLMATNMSLRLDVKGSSEMDGQSSVEDFWLDDCKPTTCNVITHLIEKSQLYKGRILGIHYTRKFDGDQDITVILSSPQVNINFPFIMQLQKLIISTLSPLDKLKKAEPIEEEGPKTLNPLEERQRFLYTRYDEPGPELLVTLTLNTPRVLLLEDATNSDTRILLLECSVNTRYKKMPSQQSLTVSISQLKIMSTSYKAVWNRGLLMVGTEVMSPCSMVVYYSTFGETQKSVGGDLGRLEFTISPATIRLLLRVLESYRPVQEELDETGPTAPQDLWLSKTLDGSIWYLQSPPDEPPVEVDESAPQTRYAVSQIYISKGEMLSVSVEAVNVVIQQESLETGTLSNALCILVGCYGQKGFDADIKEWTGKMESKITINMSISYYNPNTDVWEPLMDPVVDKSGRYQPWSLGIEATKLDPVMERRRYALTPDERVVDYSPPEMTIKMFSASALQLTLTKTCITLLTQLVEAYKRYNQSEPKEDQTDSGFRNAFWIKNDLGDNFPLTLQPGKTLKGPDSKAVCEIRNGESTYLRLAVSKDPSSHHLGELHSRPREQHKCRIMLNRFDAIDVPLSNSGRYFYPLRPVNPKYDGPKYSIVVTMDKLSSNEPTTVIISSPVTLESHTSYETAVYWAATEKLQGDPGHPLIVLPTQGKVALPLDKAYAGFLFLQPSKEDQSTTSISTQGFSWNMSSKGYDVYSEPYFIHVSPEEESYQNKLPFSLKSRPHHILRFYHPLLLNNLLPYDLEVTNIGTVIGQGGQIALDTFDHSGGEKLNIKVVIEGEEYTGHVHVHFSDDDRSTLELKSKSEAELSLYLIVEKKGTFHISVYSPYWIINKTGLTLQYKSKTSWASSKEVVHHADQRLLLYPKDEVVVRVIDKDGEYSKWSESFSLDTVGSEGVFTCSWESSKAPRQMGTKVMMSNFSSTKIITISPFFMLHNKTKDSVSIIEKGMSRLLAMAISLKPKELCPFWPETDSDLLLASLRDPSSPGYSAPFDYTTNGSLLLRLPQASAQDPCGVVVDIQVTGSANLVSFTPYSKGTAPVELVNDFFFPIVYGQRKGSNGVAMVKQYRLEPQQRVLYSWDEPNGKQELVWGMDGVKEEQEDYKILTIRDGHGNFTIPAELRGFSPPETPDILPLPPGGMESDVIPSQSRPESIESDVDPSANVQSGPPFTSSEQQKQAGIWSSVGSAAKLVGSGAKKIGGGVATGAKKVGGGVASGARTVGGGVTAGVKVMGVGVASGAKKFTSGVKRASRRLTLAQRRKDADMGYWVSFTDSLQRVILLTPEKNTSERARKDTEPKLVDAEVILSLIGVGISLVNDKKGQEIGYIGLPQSDVIWEVNKGKRRWKPVETLLSRSLEKLHEQDKKEVMPIEGSDYKVDFRDSDRLMLLNTKDRKKKGELRRSHFEGFRLRVGLSKKMTTIELRINQVQIDNQLPFSRNPTLFFCYPPSPSIASTTTPKPFIDGSLIMRRSENSSFREIQFMQVLVQEMGFILDLDFVVELATLFDSLEKEISKNVLMAEELKTVNLSLRESKAKQVSSASAKTFYKFMHLSPLAIHVSFSLDISSEQKKKLEFYAARNFALKFIIDILHTFFGFIGRAKDAELKLGSFQVQERVLTNQVLIDNVVEHYKQQGLYQMYSLVLGLEVLGNPVGFLRGLTEGTIGLFYKPIQGAVVGPDEFLEGLSIGTQQFIEGTLGGVAGMGARMTGVLGDAVAKLTFDSDFQKRRQQQSASLGQGLEAFAMGVFQGVTGIVAQPVQGAKKEGFLGFLKGTGKGVIGLVLRPTGGLIDFTSTTLSVVQKKTTLGDFELTQIRTLRYIGPDKIIYPYSPEKSTGYSMFLHIDGGKLASTDTFVGHLELTEDPLKTLMVTDSRVMIVKYNSFVSHWDDDWVVQFSELAGAVTTDSNIVQFPTKEHHGFSIPFGLGGKKPSVKNLTVNTPDLANTAALMINDGYRLYRLQQELNV